MGAAPTSPAAALGWSADLVRWYRRRRRRLPWRETRDPYAIWVSETMLQQTRSETVVRRFAPFLARFPTVHALANASERDVLHAWSGLGYYRRARNLRFAAGRVVHEHGGKLPREPAALRRLPGVGRYTAGAIASIAFGIRAPVLDGNVVRVLARVFAIPGDPRSSRVAKRLWSLAESLVPEEAPGDWNQALMELGATVCAPRDPRCEACPIHDECRAARLRIVASFPGLTRRAPSRVVRRALLVVFDRGSALVLRQPEGGRLAGLWEPPWVALAAGEPAETALRAVAEKRGVQVGRLRALGRFRHSILDERIVAEVWRANVRSRPSARSEERWAPPSLWGRLPLTGLARKAAAVLEPALSRRARPAPPRPAKSPRSTPARPRGSRA